MKTKILLIFISFALMVSAQITFEKWYGGEQEEEGQAVQQTNDGGYIIAASSRTFGSGNYDIYLIKTDEYGDTLWTHTFGGTGYDTAADVLETSDGGFIVAGYTSEFGNGDIFIIKTNSNGELLWSNTIGTEYNDHVKEMKKISDGGFILGGDTDLGGHSKYTITKINAAGDSIWSKAYHFGQTYSIQQTSDGGYILAVYPYTDTSGVIDMKIVKTNDHGNISWIKTYGGSDYDMSFAIQQTIDGGYIVAGRTDSYGAGASDFYLVKTNINGIMTWSRTYGGSSDERAFAVQQTQDGGYILAGYTQSFGEGSTDFYLVRTDSNGDTLWTRTHGGNHQDMLKDLKLTTDGGFIAVGHTYSFGQVAYPDAYVVKTNSDGIVTDIFENKNSIPIKYSLSQNYPNPFNPSTKISWQVPVGSWQTLKVYDILGNEIATLADEYKPAGKYEVEFSAKGGSASGGNAYNLPSGVYFYQLRIRGPETSSPQGQAGQGMILSKKMILIK